MLPATWPWGDSVQGKCTWCMRVRCEEVSGAVDLGLASLYMRDVLLAEPFVIFKNWLDLGGASLPGSERPANAKDSKIQKIRKL